jgi:hypothetical protein
MRKRSRYKRFEVVDDRVSKLRRQLRRRKVEPIEIGKNVAGIYLDNIARIRAYTDQLDRAADYQLFDRDTTFEENVARASVILRILGRLTSMLLKQVDRFLKCFGGPQAIAIQQIVKWASADSKRGEWLAAFAFARRSRCRA